MKTRIYLRIAKSKAAGKIMVDASIKPKFEPLKTHAYRNPLYQPTVQIALDIEIPDKEFEASRILLEAKIKEATPAVEVKVVDKSET